MANSIDNNDTSTLPDGSNVEGIQNLRESFLELQDRYTALFKLNQLSIDCADLDDFYFQVHQVIASLMNAENFYIVLYEQTLATIEFVYLVDEKDTYPHKPFPLADFKGSMTNYVIETAKPLLATQDVIDNLLAKKILRQVGTAGTDWLGVPLMNDNFVIGVMVVQSYSESTRYQQQDLELLTFAAQHVVTALLRLQDRERLQAAVDSRTTELMQQIRDREKSELLQESLYRISELTSDASIDIEKFYSMIHNIIGQLINAENFYIAKYHESDDTLSFVYFLDQTSTQLDIDFKPRKMSNRLTEKVIREGKTLLLNRAELLVMSEQGLAPKPLGKVVCWLGVPLMSAGVIHGAMVVQSYQEHIIFNEQDEELLKFVAHHVSTAVKRKESLDFERKTHELLEQQVKLRTMALEDEIKQRKLVEEQLTHSATHDHLTGLVNRSVFIDLLNHAIACNKRNPNSLFAVLFLDLDRFKVVNDSLGHHAGDELLKTVAQELKSMVRDKDTVARFGGDEFVILVEDLENEREAQDIAQRITDFLATPFNIDKQQVFIGTSIGILFNDHRYESADVMLRDADTAMYFAKDKGKGRYEIFDASMQSKVQSALALENDIREAIKQNEFSPYFQPIVSLANNEVVGFEALARWHSSKRGFVFPVDFIPLAEETGLIYKIDFLILEQACRNVERWNSELDGRDLYVSCNLFSGHFFNVSLPSDIEAVLKRVGLKPERLRLELTEGALLENKDIVLTNMQALKKMGVKILLDDFGTGYSSLSYLHRFPIDVLKIDRSFINNAHEHDNHQAIIKTIVDLATNLEMATVGEGIENVADAELLLEMECVYGQGYFFAKPMPADAVGEFLVQARTE